MTTTKHVTIWCDHRAVGGKCQEWIDHGAATVAETLRLSKPIGWRRVRAGKGYRDYCPQHAVGLVEGTQGGEK